MALCLKIREMVKIAPIFIVVSKWDIKEDISMIKNMEKVT